MSDIQADLIKDRYAQAALAIPHCFPHYQLLAWDLMVCDIRRQKEGKKPMHEQHLVMLAKQLAKDHGWIK